MGSELCITGISPKAALELVMQEDCSERLSTYPKSTGNRQQILTC
ncbi:MAG TPA: hypothetical protein VLQ20_08660 [Planococcus sp. (in: firmicutes)]|nr:hypothetical protein [Planococcus sp. (in: firmicutes)]